jgi:hypothetical protein
MKTYIPVVGYDHTNKVHRPLVEGEEYINPVFLPISSFVGNRLLYRDDGLYVGAHPCPRVFKVEGVNGVDSLPAHSMPETVVCKTLDFALGTIETLKPSSAEIWLSAGQRYEVVTTRKLSNCDVLFGFYNEPKYVDHLGYRGDSTLVGRRHTDVARPTIFATPTWDTVTGCWYVPQLRLENSQVSFFGTRFEISGPTIPGLQASAYSVASDLLRVRNSSVSIDGCLVDKVGAGSCFGFLGVEDGSHGVLRGVASQFLLGGAQITSANFGAAALSYRAFYLKLLPGYPVGNTKHERYSMVATSLGSTPTSALLDIHWTLSQAVTDAITGSDSLATFPTNSSSFGLANYIFGLVRDTQNRPINVRSNIPL